MKGARAETSRAPFIGRMLLFFGVLILLTSSPTKTQADFASTVNDANLRGWNAVNTIKPNIMQRVTGIGGFFFRSQNPTALAEWYRQHLGIDLVPEDYNQKSWSQEAGPTVFAPFPAESEYFGDGSKNWMLNFRVTDLDAIVQQLRAGGLEVVVDKESYPNGRFARLRDPEGNPIELWEPK